MKRLSNYEKNIIVDLIKDNKSLNHISKLTGKSKTTIYYHMRKIKGKQIQDIKINYDNEELIGEFIGVYAGDGNFFYDKRNWEYIIRFCFNIKEQNYAKEFEKIGYYLFNKSVNKYRQNNVWFLRYFSKDIYKFIKRYLDWGTSLDNGGNNRKSRTVFLKQNNHSNEFKIGFLRGCLDSDGYFSDNKILFGTVSEKLAKTIYGFLEDLGFENISFQKYKDKRPNRWDLFRIYVKKQDRNKFLNIIKPRNLISIKCAGRGSNIRML